MPLEIKTNHRWREFVYRSEVPPKVLKDQFSHLDDSDGLDGFFRYRGHWYHISDFIKSTGGALSSWDGYASDSFFSGVIMSLSKDGERYMVGTYIHSGESNADNLK